MVSIDTVGVSAKYDWRFYHFVGSVAALMGCMIWLGVSNHGGPRTVSGRQEITYFVPLYYVLMIFGQTWVVIGISRSIDVVRLPAFKKVLRKERYPKTLFAIRCGVVVFGLAFMIWSGWLYARNELS